MKRILSLVLVVVLVLVSGVIATAEGEKILKVHLLNEVESLELGLMTAGQSFDVVASTTEGLYNLDANGAVIPAIALSHTYEETEEGYVYTFTLREDAYWSNGTQVTAHDFEYAWKRGVDDVTRPDYTYSWIFETACIKNASKIVAHELPASDLGVEALDDFTLKVVLEMPCGFFTSMMAFPMFFPINEEFAEAKGDDYGKTSDDVLANGPFKLVDYIPAALSFNVVRNEYYYDKDNVNYDGIHFQVIKDNQAAMIAYESGELDVVLLSGELTELYMDSEEYLSKPSGYYWYISMNQLVTGLDNVNVRNAIIHAIDKETLCDYILKDGSVAAYGATSTNLAGDPETGVDFQECTAVHGEYDVALAQESWNKGLEELGVSELTLDLLTEDTEEAKLVGEYVQQQLQENLPGLTVTLTTTVKKDRLERMRRENGEYEMGLTRWGADYADPMSYFGIWATDGGHDGMSWENSKTNGYDELVASCLNGELASKPVERWQAMIELEDMIFEEAVICPVYLKADAMLIKSNVSGIEFHSSGAAPHTYKNVVIAD